MRNTLHLNGLLFLVAWLFTFNAAALPSKITGQDILNAQPVVVDGSRQKGLVVVFLSALCPCSNSHITELNDLAQKYPDFSFAGIHSNVNEDKNLATTYFKNAKLSFPVIQDEKTKLADIFKALKTPHAFIILNDGQIAYQGGVSSSNDFAKAERKFLREALEDLIATRPVRTPEGRTLGCAITRGEKHVW